jgi:cytochrome c553
MKRTNILFGILAITLSISSCKKESPITYDCTGLTPTYTVDVKPIMDARCATSSCHSANNKADGKDFSSYSAVSGYASNNAFMGSMQHLSGYKAMPQGSTKLSDTDLKTISCWISNGKPQ